MGHKDLRLGKIVYIFVFRNISLSWLLPLESLYTDVYLIFLFVLFENICELSERATMSAEREKNTTPLHWRSINTLRFIFWCEVYEIIHIWTAVVDESEEWSSQWIFQFKQLERRSLKKIRASTGFEPVTRDLLSPAPDGLWRENRGSVNRLPLDGFQYIFLLHDSENDLYNVLKTYEWIWNKAACIFLFLLNRVTKFKVLS